MHLCNAIIYCTIFFFCYISVNHMKIDSCAENNHVCFDVAGSVTGSTFVKYHQFAQVHLWGTIFTWSIDGK